MKFTITPILFDFYRYVPLSFTEIQITRLFYAKTTSEPHARPSPYSLLHSYGPTPSHRLSLYHTLFLFGEDFSEITTSLSLPTYQHRWYSFLTEIRTNFEHEGCRELILQIHPTFLILYVLSIILDYFGGWKLKTKLFVALLALNGATFSVFQALMEALVCNHLFWYQVKLVTL